LVVLLKFDQNNIFQKIKRIWVWKSWKQKIRARNIDFNGLTGLESLWTTLEKVELSLVHFEVQKLPKLDFSLWTYRSNPYLMFILFWKFLWLSPRTPADLRNPIFVKFTANLKYVYTVRFSRDQRQVIFLDLCLLWNIKKINVGSDPFAE
jgi:hypothetical protein